MIKHKRARPLRFKSNSTTNAGTQREWVGGRVQAPIYLTDGAPRRAELIAWIELPEGLVVALEPVDPDAPVSVREVLLRAMARPVVGAPRQPARIRVADPVLATELRAALSGVEVAVAPTPELQALAEDLVRSLPAKQEAASYFEDGRVSEGTIKSLFEAAARLYEISPWHVAHESQILRLDIPQLGIEGACVSIIGELGESVGVLIFPSIESFDAFVEAAERLPSGPPRGPVDLGTTVLALNFEPASELPAAMRREAASRGWPVAGARAYPRVEHRDLDGVPRPLTEQDVKIAAACAAGLVSFFMRHRAVFAATAPRPVSETCSVDGGLSVRLTAPFPEARAPVLLAPPVRVQPKVSRNAPCPCGSGQKYKKCCLPKEEAQHHAESRPATLHQMDERLVQDLFRFAGSRFGEEWQRALEVFDDPGGAIQLFLPWSVCGFRVNGQTVAERFMQERGRALDPKVREWIGAQQQAWLSIWEVLAVEPGKSVTVRDLLSGEERFVQEVSGSRMLTKRDAVLGRVVTHEGLSVFCGMHPSILPPLAAAEVVRRARGRLRKKTAIPVERLRDDAFGRYLIKRWEDAVYETKLRSEQRPTLQNTDGEDLLLTTDYFAFEPAQRDRIEGCLQAMEGVEPPDEGDTSYTFLRPGNSMHKSWQNTIVGRAVLETKELRLESNSVRRADELRRRVEGACSGLLRHRAREHCDPTALMEKREPRVASPEPEMTPELEAAVRELKAQHYAEWLDAPIPVLGGKTPRQAVRSKAGREQVDALLRDIENHESRQPAGQQADLSSLRAELRLDTRLSGGAGHRSSGPVPLPEPRYPS